MAESLAPTEVPLVGDFSTSAPTPLSLMHALAW